jgi:hypothetical protein
MAELDRFRVVPFARTEFTPADHSGPPLFTWREYYGFRNDLLRVLKPYGTTGPMGEMPIPDEWEVSKDAWKIGASDPDCFVVADMSNEHDRWNRVEASPSLVTSQLLPDLIAIVQRWPGWCVYLALTPGGLTVLGDRILYEATCLQEPPA